MKKLSDWFDNLKPVCCTTSCSNFKIISTTDSEFNFSKTIEQERKK